MPDGRPSKKAVSKTKSEIYLARGLWLPGSGAGLRLLEGEAGGTGRGYSA